MSNRRDINQKTDFNKWSISYLTEIFQCSRCKKRNTVTHSSNNNEDGKIKFQNCAYCGNPNYVKYIK
jgi:transcription elongation factor Elf1